MSSIADCESDDDEKRERERDDGQESNGKCEREEKRIRQKAEELFDKKAGQRNIGQKI